MALQYSVTIRNNQLDQVESTIGTTPILTIRTGAPPTDCAAANIGTVLATINLPSDWMGVAAAGVKAIAGGPWTDASADAAGTAGHFRIHNSANTVCHMQGTVGVSASDMIVDNAVFAAGQSFSISTFTLTAGNA
jgi:hypothetical protein